MSNDSSANYYQNKKEGLPKKSSEKYKSGSKKMKEKNNMHCVKSQYSELFSSVFFLHFLVFRLNMERCKVSLGIQFKCEKIQEKCGPE